MSPELAYSSADRTPCRIIMLIVGSGFADPGLSTRYMPRSGRSLDNRCSAASSPPGDEIEPTTNSTPTGANGLGGSDLDGSPAQNAWRSPATIASPVMPASRTASKISPRSVISSLQSPPPRLAKPAPPHKGDPGGRFCGSAREESVASELPQTFHGAREAFNWERNHVFCSAPSIDGAGLARRELGMSFPANLIVAGGLPPS